MEIEIEERIIAKLSTAAIETLIQEALQLQGYKIKSGLDKTALNGLQLQLELTKLPPPARKPSKAGSGEPISDKEAARRQKIREKQIAFQAMKKNEIPPFVEKKEELVLAEEVVLPTEHPLPV